MHPPSWCPRIGRITGMTLFLAAMSGQSMADQPTPQMDELDVVSRKQTALDAETISISATPEAAPALGGKPYAIIGLGAIESPVYDGSKTSKVGPFPYVDIHGLFNDRVFFSVSEALVSMSWIKGRCARAFLYITRLAEPAATASGSRACPTFRPPRQSPAL